ncbi:MAG: type II secretion system pilot lipoprotein GspS-beta, partial [Vibrio sp.]
MKFKNLVLCSLFAMSLIGCASVQEQHTMAEYRANVISAGLPVQYGPLNVVSARAKDNVVVVNMIYNNTTAIVSPNQLVEKSTATLCKNPEIYTLLDKGVNYQFVIRGDRGQLLADQIISKGS